MNIVETELATKPAICMYLESLRRHGDWSGSNADFQTFFHGSKRDALALRPIIENSERKCDMFITEVVERLEDRYGEEKLLKGTTNFQLYR